jgi:hypothetical protein
VSVGAEVVLAGVPVGSRVVVLVGIRRAELQVFNCNFFFNFNFNM